MTFVISDINQSYQIFVVQIYIYFNLVDCNSYLKGRRISLKKIIQSQNIIEKMKKKVLKFNVKYQNNL